MNILLIGNGGHGKVVEEVSNDCGYEKIAFLDDNSVEAIGKIEELEKFVDEFEYAFVAIGNNKLCGELMHRLEEAGYKVPVLIHSSAYLSSTAKIGKGTVIEPKAIINANYGEITMRQTLISRLMFPILYLRSIKNHRLTRQILKFSHQTGNFQMLKFL